MPKLALILLMPALLAAAAPRTVTFASYAPQFDNFEARTRGMATDRRVLAFRAEFDRILPGLYSVADAALDRRIARALTEFPSIRPAYRIVESRFPGALASAVRHFRTVFPQFASPLPIFLVHSLGTRDGGSDYVGGRKAMLFGADVIAKLHNDDSLQPFLDHELFHLEHARHFMDCDQLWCPLWQEGLATYAAASMTPGATDHQLLLDAPAPIRAATEARWGEALCRMAVGFDSADNGDIAAAFMGRGKSSGLPQRFGYYVGLRIASEAARNRTLPVLAGLDDEAARPVVAAALTALIDAAHAPCRPPAANGAITRHVARPA
ncbi:MAG: hypothetical protein H0X36_01930 [Sphingomonadaceae bacterium]|nr:hypothetical protein [Sphingomonadaceae bacterium]